MGQTDWDRHACVICFENKKTTNGKRETVPNRKQDVKREKLLRDRHMFSHVFTSSSVFAFFKHPVRSPCESAIYHEVKPVRLDLSERSTLHLIYVRCEAFRWVMIRIFPTPPRDAVRPAACPRLRETAVAMNVKILDLNPPGNPNPHPQGASILAGRVGCEPRTTPCRRPPGRPGGLADILEPF